MDRTTALAALSALANETRLDLVRLLVGTGTDGMPAGEIAEKLAVSPSRLSFHLSALEQAGLIVSRRASRQIIYAVDAAGVGGVISYLLNDCCRADPDIRACCVVQSQS
ncbi:MAG: metalloregulator ArsR/SmtB family transcription factor [Albidovulum sp.]|uniref:ArsR/SmtB family transcription factor n=1 Tax=Albidovulum sp. TaxID=1872424 RepID=UPI003CAAEBE2